MNPKKKHEMTQEEIRSLRIKVCGMRDPENIRQVAALGIDYVGFVFYPPSPRYAVPLPPEALAAVPEGVKKVGVFVDENPCTVTRRAERYGLDYVQLHGDETPAYCRRIREESHAGIIKAIAVKGPPDYDELAHYEEVVDLFLFDTATAARGGSGTAWDHRLLATYPLHTPWLLSGGIDRNILETLPHLTLPGLTGLDLNSRFETASGIKDIEKLRNFLNQLRA